MYAWFCAILTCLVVLGIYTPGFVLFLLAYLYLVYAWFCAIPTCLLVLSIWVILGQINTKNGATSQILAKLGKNIHYHKLLFDIKF